MDKLLQFLSVCVALPALCVAAFLDVPPKTYAQSSKTTFPDVKPNYWAQPFIQGLADRNIVAGYLDGTFRPEKSIDRDELAAIINKAFEQPPVRQISSGAVYKDVPQGYWATEPIEAAYEQGFLSANPNGVFRPNQNVTKAEAIVALSKGLDSPSTTAQATTQRRKPAAKRKFVLFPLAITSLMQPLLIARVNAANTPIIQPPQQKPDSTNAQVPEKRDNVATNNRSASSILNNAYADANQIPEYAVTDIAKVTQANIVVNYPNRKNLNPNKPATRAEVAALVYQTMVSQGRMKPLAINTPAYQYIVRTDTSK